MPTVIKTNIEYGKKYRDKITGFEGTAVSLDKWQTGCIRIGLRPEVGKDGKYPDVVWLDEADLEDNNVLDKDPGGPRQDPKSSRR